MAASGGENEEEFPSVVELNVGGVFYTTSLSTLTNDSESHLSQMFGRSDNQAGSRALRDSKGKFFIDRDGVLFRYILDFLRDGKLILPENFHEKQRLKVEAEHFNLHGLMNALDNLPGGLKISLSSLGISTPGYISIGYRGTFAFGRDGLADVKFRKLGRILVCGRVSLCREVFGDTLNESRDPDRGSDARYSARFFLKHSSLEMAFDNLQDAGFRCCTAAGSNTSCGGISGEPLKPGMDSEENKWNHYNEFIFVRC